MSVNDRWRRAFALQAQADLRTRDFLCRPEARQMPECHRLQFLQMACEKLVKAHMYDVGMIPPRAHTVIAKHLPGIVNEYQKRQTGKKLPSHLDQRVRALAREIELLAPAVDDAGRRPVNCEYPWSDPVGDRIFIPAEYEFTSLKLHDDVAGRVILKVLPIAIADLLEADRV